jgi:hypothetical protein
MTMTENNNKLTPPRVMEVFEDCLFKDGEDTSTALVVEGIVNKYGLNPERVEKHREDVRELLSQLPVDFFPGSGGGMSFLNACNNRDGELWTGEHRVMECLFVLGMALELVVCLLPREIWPALPGGMPYYMVVKSGE